MNGKQQVTKKPSTEDDLSFTSFKVVPDVGLKHAQMEFVLGMPINQCIAMMQQHPRMLTNVELKYSKKDPCYRDIIIYIGSTGIKLYFDGHTQLIKLIEVDNLSKINLTYNDTVFSDPSNMATLDRVNEFFGSTHPGSYDDKHNIYVQSWPGLSFCFPTAAGENSNLEVRPGFGGNLRSLKYDANSQPKLTKMSIYRGQNPSEPEPVDTPFSCYCGQNRTRKIEAIYENETIVGLDIEFDTQNGRMVDGEYEVSMYKRQIYFGDSVADVQAILGAPTKVFYKSDDKMKIHRGLHKETLYGPPNFFFNYFVMGLDVLFDFVSKRVVKFVLHTNAPGHCDFGVYSRCNFSIFLNDKQYEIRTDSKFDEFSHAFMDDSNTPRPVVLTRQEQQPFGSTFCYGVKQVIVEVMDNWFLSSVTIYDGSKEK
ncbi:hypothetical protein CRE_03799 [Caenorhabditis remanei]|uniref:Uncharacterized protein n=2 Tax=Caenorhabditis remanei TaxID=31234 RepID=E3LYC2_CAERE|nr:hypothetical protein CRE_03799 [Caenorhabditis remanei]